MSHFIFNSGKPGLAPDGCEIIRTEKLHGCLRVPYSNVRPIEIKYAGTVYSYLCVENSDPRRLIYSPHFRGN